jgi:hypothetical protein
MMISVVPWLFLLSGIALAICAKIQSDKPGFLDHSRLASGHILDRADVAIIERDIRALRAVVIISDTVDFPEHLLLDAVYDNLSQCVSYFFYVSPQNVEKSRQTILPLFEGIAQTIKSQVGSAGKVVVGSSGVPLGDFPYIFYIYKVNDRDHMSVVAFRGHTKNVGIADQYTMIDPDAARTIILALGAQNPGEQTAWVEDVETATFPLSLGSNVIEFRGNRSVTGHDEIAA